MNYTKLWQEHADQCAEVIKEINILRSTPRTYIPYMMAYVEGYTQDCLNIPGVDYGIALEEGK